MSRTATVMTWTTVILLAAVYVFPLWVISLQAPQYPQGLGLHIWVDKITGAQPHDLQNINGLNHYIGMRKIEPEVIPELRYMKYIVAALMVLGALTAIIRRRWLLLVFAVLCVVLSAIGMYDFYQWEYNYGHELDPDAAIKVPGMSYQPPMFGTKQLLNFRTTAWPGVGGIAAMLAVALTCLAAAMSYVPGWRHRAFARRAKREHAVAIPVMLAVAAYVAGCSSGPQPIAYNEDQCSYCMMTISNRGYGAEVVTSKGRAFKYDSIECMAAGIHEGDDYPSAQVAQAYVTDFANPGNLIDAHSASILHSDQLPSPMGGNYTAFADAATAREVQDEKGGEILGWEEVLTRDAQ